MTPSPVPTPQPPPRFAVGRWAVDPSVDEVEADGRVVKLEPRTMRLLVALARRPGELVATDALLDSVWPGLVVTHGSLYEAIAQLRKVLGADQIATVPRKGYRLVAPVDWPQVQAHAKASPTSPDGTSEPRLGDRSVAVLPFRVRNLPASHSFLRESLADDVIAELSRGSGHVVVARGTMLRYGAAHDDPRQVGAELGVRYVVDGLAELRGEQLHLTVHVVDAVRRMQTWADTVEVALASWPDTGPLLVARIGRALNLELLDLASRSEAPRPRGTDDASLRALALATQAWLELVARPETRAVNERAAAAAEEAMRLDPRQPLASTCLAFCDWRAAQFGWTDVPRERLLERARAHVERAIGLGPRDPDGYYVLSLVAYGSRELVRAEEALQHCLRLSSSYAPAYGLLGLIRTRRGFPEETNALCDRAFALSPREPLRVVWHLAKAWAALALNDDRTALEESQRAMAVNPDFATCYVTGAAAAQRLQDAATAGAWVAFLRERTVFKSVSALRARTPPPGGPAHAQQMDVVAKLLSEAGLPAA